MMSLKHQEHTKQLLEDLSTLLNTEDKNSVPAKIFDYKDGYVIHLIPTNFQHPLKDIVNLVKKQFFLVSKLPNIEKDESNDSSDDEGQEETTSLELPELPVLTIQHVFVGTPISQQVYHLFWQENFHVSETEIVEHCLDISNLLKLELKDARYIASLYVQCVKQHKELPEMWLLCDRASPQGIDYIGVAPCVAADPKQPQEVSTVVVRSEDHNERKDGFSLRDLKKQHMIFHRVNQAETRGYARYKLYGTLENSERYPSETQSSISLEFAWDGVRAILQPPPSSSNAVLKICANPEDVQAILPGITGELNMLGSLFSMMRKKIKEESAGEAENSGVEEEFDRAELKKGVLEFLDKLRLQSMGQPKETESVSTSPSAPLSFGAAEGLNRQDLDNTESLWLFLKELPSTEQMFFCLEVIFQQLFLGEYQPVLYVNNQTQIANLMKEVISCSSDKERAEIKAKFRSLLTPAAALQGVVDIGIDKLQNDYINYFIKKELVTKDLLEYFITKSVSSSEKLQRLLKLHCILSLETLAFSYAHISFDDLRQLIPAALKFYENHSHTEIPVFSLSLPAFSASSSEIKNKCVRQFQPQTWVAAITTSNHLITIVQLDAKDQLESFVEGNSTSSQGNSFSITTANVHKVCI